MVPSESIAGLELMLPLVANCHFSVPFGFIAYNFPFSEPTYMTPLVPIAGLELMPPPVANSHFCVPFG